MKQRKGKVFIRIRDGKYQAVLVWGKDGNYNHLSTSWYSSLNWATTSLRKYSRILGIVYSGVHYVEGK
jgi:hypothetical protein